MRIVARRTGRVRGSGVGAVAEREGFGALTAEVADLRTAVAALNATMGQVLAGQQAHTALLDELLAAVTDLGEPGGDDGLAQTLARIANTLEAQGDVLIGMRTGLDGIPAAVAAAVQTRR
jgi:hypothetical protein